MFAANPVPLENKGLGLRLGPLFLKLPGTIALERGWKRVLG